MTTVLAITSFLCLAASNTSTSWLLPLEGDEAIARYGHKDGLSVIVPAYRCPRGLIGIYAPFLDLPEFKPLNFVAIEPVVNGYRGYSEVEESKIDGVQGLRLWTTDDLDRDSKPTTIPAKGKIETIDGVQTLSFYIHIERMTLGAQPIIQVTFRADKPREVSFRVYAADGSAKMESCILSATCGNYARLRLLELKSETADSTKLWEGTSVPENGFFPHREWSLQDLVMDGSAAIVRARPNESDPLSAEYDPKVPKFWKYAGKPGIQYWRCTAPVPELVCRVSGRETYYGQPGATIPNGRSIENFEFEAPFAEGQEFCFGVAPLQETRE